MICSSRDYLAVENAKNFPNVLESISCLKHPKEIDIVHRTRNDVMIDVNHLESPTLSLTVMKKHYSYSIL